ncbi:MAG TPA: hypothetical protein PLE99_11435 [Candidatus Thiothrix moscowensis]|uniref:hypothetical protein n=1 Tax=unclassified Thiothrix TaxID=2636184 RepID=UPI0025F0BCC2|nr:MULTISPECIES: hypothetical protein [unclassified Thiothrix]HRJ53371.1 hypothetical protein [Candidatus Thiothrix moscowensis]HRJ94652.1 hypothetical protein [Candidatus Thiothrix moscowensis]
MLYRYRYSVGQKAMFVSLWLLSGLFVTANFFANPIFSLDNSTQTLSMLMAVLQVSLLVVLWCQFAKASCSISGMLRWLGAGVLVLPYFAQVGFLSYITL